MAEGEGVSTRQVEEGLDRAKHERGIDVSHWQGKIDWGKVAKSGIKHAFVKMSEGGQFVDPSFVENWNGAQKAGIRVHCYHYFHGLGFKPEEQMENIRKNTRAVNFNPTTHSLAIDVEEKGNENATPVQMADSLHAVLTLIKKDPILSRCRVMIYTSHGYWDYQVEWDKYKFEGYPLWLAHWDTQNPHPPQPWRKMGKTWSWWQHSSIGRVDGIDGDVDLDWVHIPADLGLRSKV